MQRLPTRMQVIVAAVLMAGACVVGFEQTIADLHPVLFVLGCVFLIGSLWKLALIPLSRRAPRPFDEPDTWPRYTVVAALCDEAEVVPQLIERLGRIDYPAQHLEGFLVLEAHDLETIDAAERTPRPDWLRILVVPPGAPQTKPRALNHALSHATGDYLAVYDAEDDPDPLQLREAAARFGQDHSGFVACLQAPLRIRRVATCRPGSPFLDRQFASEYAALFEVTLPAMARLGLPYPLGGTSNHFRVSVLREVGGWDAWNVTEDADLGFRLWRHGFRQDTLSRPTYECPPGGFQHWLPQRTRWLKGYMQTWGVHTRDLRALGWRGVFALTVTVGQAIATALASGPSIAWLAATLMMIGLPGSTPLPPPFATAVFALGVSSAWLTCAVGAARARISYGPADMLAGVGYWFLLSLAFGHALYRLVRQPHAWDKTQHVPDTVVIGVFAAAAPEPEADAGRRAA